MEGSFFPMYWFWTETFKPPLYFSMSDSKILTVTLKISLDMADFYITSHQSYTKSCLLKIRWELIHTAV